MEKVPTDDKVRVINTKKINETHKKIKEIVESYKTINERVTKITSKVNENWVGQAHTEFDSQYNILMRKIDDFGDTLIDIYNALVDAEAEYQEVDDQLRQQFVMAENE